MFERFTRLSNHIPGLENLEKFGNTPPPSILYTLVSVQHIYLRDKNTSNIIANNLSISLNIYQHVCRCVVNSYFIQKESLTFESSLDA